MPSPWKLLKLQTRVVHIHNLVEAWTMARGSIEIKLAERWQVIMKLGYKHGMFESGFLSGISISSIRR